MTFNKTLSSIGRRSVRGYRAKPASEVKLDGSPTIWGAPSLQTIEKSSNVYAGINSNNNVQLVETAYPIFMKQHEQNSFVKWKMIFFPMRWCLVIKMVINYSRSPAISQPEESVISLTQCFRKTTCTYLYKWVGQGLIEMKKRRSWWCTVYLHVH